MRRRTTKAVLLGLLLVVSLAVHAASASAATERHLYNPTISLTGECGTDALDPVADPWCPGPPAPTGPFLNPNITIDSFGDMYVSSHPTEGPGGRVDVFSPDGDFLTEISVEGARSLAVDADGVLYVAQFRVGGVKQVIRFKPTTYKPVEEEIEYGEPGEVIVPKETPGLCQAGFVSPSTGIAVDPTTGILYVSPGNCVVEFSSATDGNKLETTIGEGVLSQSSAFLAVDPERNRLYVSDAKENPSDGTIEIFELRDPHAYLGRLNGAVTPDEKFLSGVGRLTLDVDEETGHLFVSDLYGAAAAGTVGGKPKKTPRVYEMGAGFGAQEELVETYEFAGFNYVEPGEVAVDNSVTSPNRHAFYVPSGDVSSTTNHTYAFKLTIETPPVIESASSSGVTETEATLRATINPGGGETHYRLEYTDQADFTAGGTLAGGGMLAPGSVGVNVLSSLSGLAPDTAYRFRVVAENAVGDDVVEGGFRTYAPSAVGSSCLNEQLRTGFSAGLPDCRAYELVTPPDTNGRSPLGAGEIGIYFPTLQASPAGNKATFRVEGGSLPGSEGAGPFNGENYLSKRGSDGWTTQLAGPSGTDALAPTPGGISPDQEYSFWGGEAPGTPTLVPHIRYPDGHSDLVARGSLGSTLGAVAKLISEGGSHVIFETTNSLGPAVPLEPVAPPKGTTAVYDRTADGTTHVVSLLPGGGTPAGGQNAAYVGASYDGTGIAFEIGGVLYLRRNDTATYEVGKNITFAGVAEGGGRVFYLQAGNLFALDTATGTRIAFSKGGSAIPVNVSPDGSAAYFISPDVLSGKNPNPAGAVAVENENNLYLSREGRIAFVGIVTDLDIESEPLGNGEIIGLGRWVASLGNAQIPARPGSDTSRTTPDGSVLLFESRALLTTYDPQGHAEVYRYDSRNSSLACLSCNPTEAAASSDASLQTIEHEAGGITMISTFARMANLVPSGNRAFFQSFESLVPSDVDNRQDVYEWETQGVGSCGQPGGCIYLVSGGQSARDEHLFAASASGDDVFVLSSELLVRDDQDQTPSLYDARVGGGFPEVETTPCQDEGCRGALTSPPTLPSAATALSGTNGNVANRRCPKGKHKVRRRGKTRCVQKHHHHHHHQRSKSRKSSGGK